MKISGAIVCSWTCILLGCINPACSSPDPEIELPNREETITDSSDINVSTSSDEDDTDVSTAQTDSNPDTTNAEEPQAPVDLLILLLGNKNLPEDEYKELAVSIAEQSNLDNVSVEILASKKKLPTATITLQTVRERIREIGEQTGNEPKNIFVIGHGQTGPTAAQVVQRGDFHGAILMGSHMDRSTGSIDKYPAPALILAGDLDGVNRLTYLVSDSKMLTKMAETDGPELVYSVKPMIVLPGVNHGHFAGGRRYPLDLASPLSQYEATEAIARAITTFIRATSAVFEPSPDDLTYLVQNSQKNRESLAVFSRARDLENSSWCETAQSIIANLSEEDSLRLSTTSVGYSNFDAFTNSKPGVTWIYDNGNQQLQAKATFFGNFISDISDIPWGGLTGPVIGSQALACKMKSQSLIHETLSAQKAPASGCNTVNAAALEWAKENLPSDVLNRFDEQGTNFQFETDNNLVAGFLWTASDVDIEYKSGKKRYDVQSGALITNTSVPVLGGMHYCWLFTPAKAVEWILVDSLPRTPSN